jgi:2,3-bisphosphoglycerate-independent phosphoglycerate mutase
MKKKVTPLKTARLKAAKLETVKLCFVILDGFGQAKPSPFNAITSATTPFFDFVRERYPFTTLRASGTAAGLPEGYVGNSEVGHMAIGAGRIIQQPFSIIQQAIQDETFFAHPLFDTIAERVKNTNKKIHILGLLSDVAAHAHIDHFLATTKALFLRNVKTINIHPFLDGRDTSPYSAFAYLELVQDYLRQHTIGTNLVGTIATLQGRFYAMDRDNNWERTKKSYDILTMQKIQDSYQSWQEIVVHYQEEKLSEEFLEPVQLCKDAVLQEGDIIIVLNYREDRLRQLLQALSQKKFDQFARTRFVRTEIITLVSFNGIELPSFYKPEPIKNTLKELLSKQKKTMFVIAETEKFAHVTYFLSCGKQEPFPYETQFLIPSLKLQRYDVRPEMKAREITETVLEYDQTKGADVYIINYANPDMVGHSGNLKATIQAIEIIDQEMQKLYDYFVKQKNGILIITADHGKAESMWNPATKKIVTGHTTNPVPFFFITENSDFADISVFSCKELKDIMPFILSLFH